MRRPSRIMCPLGSTSVTRTAIRAVMRSELLIVPPPSKLLSDFMSMDGYLPPRLKKLSWPAPNRKLEMLALMPVFLAVLVLFCLADSLVSSTTMVSMSPTLRARLSAKSRRADDSVQRDPLAASTDIGSTVMTVMTVMTVINAIARIAWIAKSGHRNWGNSFMGIGDFWTGFTEELGQSPHLERLLGTPVLRGGCAHGCFARDIRLPEPRPWW